MPIIYRPQHHQPEAVACMYRAADVCVVSSLHDGMNLVAKEFIASRNDEHGVLVLSEFTGAARELEHAVHVNPFAVDPFADSLHTALMMSPDDQRRRMRALRERVASHTVFDWAGELLTAASRRMEPVR
jgi:trehalose 6-phosphate synthase